MRFEGAIRGSSLAVALGALCGVCDTRPAFAAGSADYTITATTGLYEAPPPGAQPVGGGSGIIVSLPFEFSYFGVLYDHVTAKQGGYIAFANDSASTTWAFDVSAVSPGTSSDGAVAPFSQLMTVNFTHKWTAGTAPNRRFVISAENMQFSNFPGPVCSFQVKLHEGSNRIEFAYKPDSVPSTWNGVPYSQGLVAPGADTRWVAPVSTSVTLMGHPPNDYRFDPRYVTLSGRFLYDRLTPTVAGLGTTTSPVPIANCDLDILYSDGRRANRAATDAAGNFQTVVTSGPAASVVDIYAYTRSTACVVQGPGFATGFVVKAAASVTNSLDTNIGTKTVDVTADPTGAFRAPANVLSAVQRAYDWASTRTAAAIPKLTITYDPASAAATSYTETVGTTPAAMTVAGPGAPNNDAWDDPVILRTWGRHFLSTLDSVSVGTPDDAFDKMTTDANALAVGFGHFVAAAVTGQSVWIDSTGVATATSYDLEGGTVTAPRGTATAASVAMAFYDLLDPANETTDVVDGSNAASDRVIQAIDALATAPDAGKFYDSWGNLAFPAFGISRIWIAGGLVADDANEPNDLATEPAVLGALGTRLDGLTLNIGNEDWFDVTIASATDVVQADLTFPRTATPATVELELLDAMGARVADKVDGGTGPISISAGPLAAGTYRLRALHVSGKRVPAYTIQVLRRLQMDHAPLPSWTTGFPYQRPIALTGGIGTLGFSVTAGTAPVGLLFDAANQRVSGTPVQTGTFDFSLAVADSGSPQHMDLASYHVVVNPVLAFDLGEFVPFATGKTTNATRAHTGGTSPLAVSVASGALPAGISLAANDLVFTGTASVPGSTAFGVHAVDVAGSAHDESVVGVGCVPAPTAKTPADLAAGASACGFFFDAVGGSSVKFSATTASKRAKRALRTAIIGPDGLPVAGAAVKAGTGKTSGAVASVPVTGRYFAVVASDAGDATQLLGTVTVAAPKKGKGAIEGVGSGDVVAVEFGALAGAKLSFKATAEKSSGLTLAILALIGPNGAAVPLDGASQKGTSALLSATLGLSGTWMVRVRATGSAEGKVAYSLKLAEPKGGVFVVD